MKNESNKKLVIYANFPSSFKEEIDELSIHSMEQTKDVVKFYPEDRLSLKEQVDYALFLIKTLNDHDKVVMMTNSFYIIKEINNIIALTNKKDDSLFKSIIDKRYSKVIDFDFNDIEAYEYIDDKIEKCEICPKFGINVRSMNYAINEVFQVTEYLSFNDIRND